MQWNMKLHRFINYPKGDKIYVTVISIQIRESRNLVHNVSIRVSEEDRIFPGCIEVSGSVYLGEGSLEIFVNGDNQISPGDNVSSPDNDDDGLRVIDYNMHGACTRMCHD